MAEGNNGGVGEKVENLKKDVNDAKQIAEGFKKGGKVGAVKEAAKVALNRVKDFMNKSSEEKMKAIAQSVGKFLLKNPMIAIALIATIIIAGVTAALNMETTSSIDSMNRGVASIEDSLELAEFSGDREQVETAVAWYNKYGSFIGFTEEQLTTLYNTNITDISDTDLGRKLAEVYSGYYGENDNDNVLMVDDRDTLLKHILRTEKHNFNSIKWVEYSHTKDGVELTDSNTTFIVDAELGLKYPDDNTITDKKELRKSLIDLASPYLLCSKIPVAFVTNNLTSATDSSGIPSSQDILKEWTENHQTTTDSNGNTLTLSSSDIASVNKEEDGDSSAGNFAYEIIKNASSDITIDKYVIQSCMLKSYYYKYIPTTYQDSVDVTIYFGDLSGGIYSLLEGATDFTTDLARGVILSSPFTSSAVTSATQTATISVGQEVTTDEEDVVNGKSYSSETRYYVSTATAFDVVIQNSYLYTKYKEEDVNNKVNESSKNVTDQPYQEYEEATKNNRFEGKDFNSHSTINGLANSLNASVTFLNNYDPNTKSVTIRLTGNHYVKREGTQYNILRTWRDSLSSLTSKHELLNYDNVTDYVDECSDAEEKRLEEERNEGGVIFDFASITRERFDNDEGSVNHFKKLVEKKQLNTIDIMDLYPTTFTKYLYSHIKREKFVGIGRRDFTNLAYNDIKQIFSDMIDDDSRRLPFVYGSSLGFETSGVWGSSGMSFTSGFNLLKEYIRSWEGKPPMNADGTKYTIFDDKTGVLTVGYGITTRYYGNKLLEAGATSLEEGAEVDIDIVDALEDTIIKQKIEAVKSKTTGIELTEYQIHSLVSFMYNVGNIEGFNEKYMQYWNQETDDQYEEQNNNPNLEHGLYKEYFGLYTHDSNGNELQGLINRRVSEFTLFQSGYYDRINKWWTPISGNNIEGIDLYNEAGGVDESKVLELQAAIESRLNMVEAPNNLTGQCTRVGYTERCAVTGKFYGSTGADRNEKTLQIYQCTWWANSRASEYLYAKDPVKYPNGYPTARGNGGEYYRYNLEGGWFAYGPDPKPNSIGCGPSSSSCGHVYYVEAVDYTSGYYYVSHAGGGEQWFGIQKVKIGEGPFGYPTYGFIYLDEPLK